MFSFGLVVIFYPRQWFVGPITGTRPLPGTVPPHCERFYTLGLGFLALTFSLVEPE